MKKQLNVLTNQNNLLKKSNRFLCALSGGQDSISVFFLLLHLSQQKLIFFEIIYFQHFSQTKNFFTPLFIFKLSFQFEIAFSLALPQQTVFSENRSRYWRFKIFYRLAKLEKTRSLVTGQTLTDKIEKCFTNLFRGTSSKSLSVSHSIKPTKTFFSNVILKPPPKRRQVCKFEKKINTVRGLDTLKFQSNKISFITIKYKSKANSFSFYKKQKITPLQFFSLKKQLLENKNTRYHSRPCCAKKSLKAFSRLDSSSFCLYSRRLRMQLILIKPLSTESRFFVSKLIKFYDFLLLRDLTNFDTQFSRNKIRHKFFPVIRYLFNKKFESLIVNLFKTLELEQKVLQEQTLEVFFLVKLLNIALLLNQNITSVDRFGTFLSDNTIRESASKLIQLQASWFQNSLMQKIFFDYSDTELTYLQISTLTRLITKTKQTK